MVKPLVACLVPPKLLAIMQHPLGWQLCLVVVLSRVFIHVLSKDSLAKQ